jgi:hypothetical protein
MDETKKMDTKSLLKVLKERDHFGDLGVDARIVGHRSTGACCLHHQGILNTMRSVIKLNAGHPDDGSSTYVRLHGTISQKTVFIFPVERT